MKIVIRQNSIFLSTSYLFDLGVKPETVWSWRKPARCLGNWLTLEQGLFIQYSSIPAKTRSTLPPEKKLRAELTKHDLYEKLNNARCLDHAKFTAIYEPYGLSRADVTHFAQLHAVFALILEMYENGFNELEKLHTAFNRLYPGKYDCKRSLSNKINDARKYGIERVLDKRKFGNHRVCRRETDPQVKYVMAILTSHSDKYTGPEILKKANAYFQAKGLPLRKLSWVKKCKREWLKNPEVYANRYGKQQASKLLPFATMEHADRANLQWLIDGKTMPFWDRVNGRLVRYTLVIVIDACSKKVVGCGFGVSENTDVIKEAIRDAINNTGAIPFEMVADNHAFNKTDAAKGLVNFFAKRGAIWNVSHVATHHAIVERYNQYLDAEFKNQTGYLHKSVKSRSLDNVVSSEIAAENAKMPISYEVQRARAIAAVYDYNRELHNGKSPNQVYTELQPEAQISIGVFDLPELFENSVTKKVVRNQVTIIHNKIKHEYQLPAHLFTTYNNAEVIVRYEDLQDCIYLFDKGTNEPIIELKPKETIKGAKANQTQADIDKMNRVAGRRKGIETQAKKQLEQITAQALQIDPEAHEMLTGLTTEKTVLQRMREDGELRQIMRAKGIDEAALAEKQSTVKTIPAALQPRPFDRNPVRTTNNKIGIVNLKDIYDDSE